MVMVFGWRSFLLEENGERGDCQLKRASRSVVLLSLGIGSLEVLLMTGGGWRCGYWRWFDCHSGLVLAVMRRENGGSWRRFVVIGGGRSSFIGAPAVGSGG